MGITGGRQIKRRRVDDVCVCRGAGRGRRARAQRADRFGPGFGQGVRQHVQRLHLASQAGVLVQWLARFSDSTCACSCSSSGFGALSCMHACMHQHTHARTHTHTHTRAHARAYLPDSVRTQFSTDIHTRTHAYACRRRTSWASSSTSSTPTTGWPPRLL